MQCIYTHTHIYKYLVDILSLQWQKDLTETFIYIISFMCVCLYTLCSNVVIYGHRQRKKLTFYLSGSLYCH